MSGAHGPGVGSAAEEAARLLAAAEAWARSRADAVLDPSHLATGAAECTVCPLCTAISALRTVRPEAVAHLLDAAGSLVAALRATSSEGPPPPPSPGVQRIDLDEPSAS